MRKDNFDIDYEKLPRRSQKNLKAIKKILQFAYMYGYDVWVTDYATGMIQFKRGDIKINVYTSTLTIAFIENGDQSYTKGLSCNEIVDFICEKAKRIY